MMVSSQGGERRSGTVEEFDETVGLGSVAGAGGGRYPFHCTQIAGGSRTVDVGATVTFVVIPGHGGVWEAGDLRVT